MHSTSPTYCCMVHNYTQNHHSKGWDPANRLRGDPRRFALEARNSSNSSTDSSERRRSSGAAMLLRRKSSTPALLANSSSGLSSPALDRIMSRGSMPSTGAQDLESTISNSNSNGPALADAAPGVSFSADDFNTVAGLLDSGLPHAFRQEVTAFQIISSTATY